MAVGICRKKVPNELDKKFNKKHKYIACLAKSDLWSDSQFLFLASQFANFMTGLQTETMHLQKPITCFFFVAPLRGYVYKPTISYAHDTQIPKTICESSSQVIKYPFEINSVNNL